jgi:hypothetical protein
MVTALLLLRERWGSVFHVPRNFTRINHVGVGDVLKRYSREHVATLIHFISFDPQ